MILLVVISYYLVQIVWIFLKKSNIICIYLYNQLFVDYLNADISSYTYPKPSFSSWKILNPHGTQGDYTCYLVILHLPIYSTLNINDTSQKIHSLAILTTLALPSQVIILHLLISFMAHITSCHHILMFFFHWSTYSLSY